MRGREESDAGVPPSDERRTDLGRHGHDGPPRVVDGPFTETKELFSTACWVLRPPAGCAA
jgi:hypothetical protein